MGVGDVVARGDAVVVVIDEQERLTAAMERRDAVIASTGRVVRAAALVGVPVIVTRQYPKGLGDLDPLLRDALAAVEQRGTLSAVVDKVAFDCFAEPGFVHALQTTGRAQLVIVGMETHICVAQTALAATARGLSVHVVADACCSRRDDDHEIALSRLARAGTTVTTSESVMYELVGAAGTDEFRALLGIVKE